jgi:hypothetical protein
LFCRVPFTTASDAVYQANGHEQRGAPVSTHNESDTKSKPGPGTDHPFKVTVRSLAGHSDKVTIKPSDTIGEVSDKEVKLFVNKGWLTAGDYSLSLPRVSENELDPSATFGDLGIVEGDVLVLINRKPQVDGGLDGVHCTGGDTSAGQ